MTKARLYISYCQADMDATVLQMILADLNRGSKIDVISDKIIQVGDNLPEFMALISDCHAVLILCTPEYNRRVVNRAKSGVYTEYQAIIDADDRLNAEYDEQSNAVSDNTSSDPLEGFGRIRDRRFSILPVLISGNIEDSVPAEFRNRLISDFVGMTTTTWRSSGYTRPQKGFRNAYDTFIAKVISVTQNIFELSQGSRSASQEDIFHKIFFELKHDTQSLDVSTVNKIFVETLEFRNVVSQRAYLLVGRKGSGKSTIADFLAYGPQNRWKAPILYNVDELPLEFLFNIVAGTKHRSDRQYVLIEPILMQFAWECLFHYLCYEAIEKESNVGALSAAQHERFLFLQREFKHISAKMLSKLSLRSMEQFTSVEMRHRHAVFAYSLAEAISYNEKIIKDAPNDESAFVGQLVDKISIEHFCEHVFGMKFLSKFYELINNCNRNFLITLDGFDASFQIFRQTTNSVHHTSAVFDERNTFERDWLTGLIAAVRRSKRRVGQAPLASKVDFCVTIPKDRFIEILDDDRDAYQLEGRHLDISWTGIELSSLLRKRVEAYKEIETDGTLKPLRRLHEALGSALPIIPSMIPVTLEKRTADVGIFHYILRHTFWRPRDVLFLWGRLISAAEYYLEQGLVFDVEAVKLVVARNLQPIIRFEFLSEFGGSVQNLSALIHRFEGRTQLMSYEEFSEIVRPMKLSENLIPGVSNANEIERTLRVLYMVGFIGIEPKRGAAVQRQYETRWIFTFNEGDDILSIISPNTMNKFNIVIHPMFIEYLGLVPFRDALVCDFDDEYLVKQAARQAARGGLR